MQIYLFMEEKQAGPYTPEQMQTLLAEGKITPETPAWHEGMDNWVPVKNIPPPIPPSPIPPQNLPPIPKPKGAELAGGPPEVSQDASDDDPSAQKALAYVRSVLVASERIEAWAIQNRFRALLHRRDLVVLTTGRFIVLKRGLFGGFTMGDIRWQDMHDTKIEVGIFSASIKVIFEGIADMALWSTSAGRASIRGLRKDQAQAVYRLCLAQDQAWREKRRIREMEEMRAKAGLVQMAGGGQGGTSSIDPLTRLQQAKQMLDARLITDSEYEAMKAKIISTF